MKVFNVYYKIIKKNSLGIAVYLLVFLAITLLMTLQNSGKESSSFDVVRIDMTLINEDEENPLVNGMIEYLGDYVNFVEVKNEKESIQDALFFRETEYVLRIPNGFYEDFLNDGNLQIEKMGVENSYSNFHMDTLINKYLNTWKVYKNLLPDISEDEILKYIKEDIDKETIVELSKKDTSESKNSLLITFFNLATYSLFGVLIAGISKVMEPFLQKDIKMRNQSSPIKAGVLTGRLILGNFWFSLVVFAVHLIAAALLLKKDFLTLTGLLMSLNMFVFTLTVLSLSILVATLVKNKNAQTAAANTISLGMCFIGGAFVPQEILGDTVKQIASFTPAYWYVRANEEINQLSTFTFSNCSEILYSMGIQLGFAIAIISVNLFLARQRGLATV